MYRGGAVLRRGEELLELFFDHVGSVMNEVVRVVDEFYLCVRQLLTEPLPSSARRAGFFWGATVGDILSDSERKCVLVSSLVG